MKLPSFKNLLKAIPLIFFAGFFSACVNYHNVEIIENFSKSARKPIRPGSVIAVMPMTGQPHIRRSASEWFSHHLKKSRQDYKIVDPAQVELMALNNGLVIDLDPQIETNVGYSRQVKSHFLVSPVISWIKEERIVQVTENYKAIRPRNKEKRLKKASLRITYDDFNDDDVLQIGRLVNADLIITGHTTLIYTRMDFFALTRVRLLEVSTGRQLALVERTGQHMSNFHLSDIDHAAISAKNAAVEMLKIFRMAP